MRERLLVDSSVWIDYLAGRDMWHANYLDSALSTHEICLCDLVVVEVLQGIRNDTHYKHVRDLLMSYTLIPSGGKRLAVQSAHNYRFFRKRGISLRSTVDCIIATSAIDAGVPLLANDRDYLPFAQHLGLHLIFAQS